MTTEHGFARLAAVLLAGASLVTLAACSYDSLNHADGVSYQAGDAVKANLEAQTDNPAKPSMKITEGLGKNGKVIADEDYAAD